MRAARQRVTARQPTGIRLQELAGLWGRADVTGVDVDVYLYLAFVPDSDGRSLPARIAVRTAAVAAAMPWVGLRTIQRSLRRLAEIGLIAIVDRLRASQLLVEVREPAEVPDRSGGGRVRRPDPQPSLPGIGFDDDTAGDTGDASGDANDTAGDTSDAATCNREPGCFKNRSPENRNRENRNRVAVDEVVAAHQPWRLLDDSHLLQLPAKLLERLFDDAVKQRWLQGTRDDRLLLYALAFQAAATNFGSKPRRPNPRTACFISNLKHKRWHFASDDARAWARDQVRQWETRRQEAGDGQEVARELAARLGNA